MQTRKIWVVLTVAASLILGGCTLTRTPTHTITNTYPSKPTNVPALPTNVPGLPLSGTRWILASLNGQAASSGPLVTINFTDSEIHGTDGCNSYSSSYTVNGSQLSIDENTITPSTLCVESITQQASGYAAALAQAAAYEIDDTQLALLEASGKTLATFTKQSRELDGTSWIVTGYNDGSQAVVSVLPDTELTADFNADGIMSGRAGCNYYFVAYDISEQSLKTSSVARTAMYCTGPGLLEQESLFLKALETVAAYFLDGNQLELRTAGGELAVSLIKASAAVTPDTQTPQTGASIAQALPNAEYPIEAASSGKAQLKDGLFEEPAAPGSAAKIQIQLGKEQAFGDVNSDGTQDAAVTLVAETGGSGTFTYLAVVLNEQGTARPVSSILLGDRIRVESLAIQSGSMVVTLLTRKPDEPMSAEPTLEVTRTFTLEGGKLVEVQP